jgi:hypothetical protein
MLGHKIQVNLKLIIPQMILLHPHKIMSKIKRMNKMKIKLKIKREALIKGGGDEDDGDHQGSRIKPPHLRVHETVQRDHPMDNIFGDIKKGVTTKSRVANFCQHYLFVSSLEPSKVEDVLHDLNWVVTMEEELNNLKRNEVWSLVERSKQNVVGTK